MGSFFDIAIAGGGPAGATAGRLLAKWGYSVVLVDALPGRTPSLAECIPPSTRKLFQFLGIQDSIEAAGLFRTTGNTVWWGKSGRRVEPYPEGWGYEVLRSDFDRLLIDLAKDAGVRVKTGKVIRATPPLLEVESAAKRTQIRARFALDCTGRSGVIARHFRVRESASRTVAICGVWRSETGWKLPDASHTLVESYADGWAWSVPVSPTIRYVAVMVDPGETRPARAKGLEAAYRAEIAKTRAFRRIFAHSELDQGPWGRDASIYSSRRYAGPGFLLVGDAGSFLDPLSSFGMKKAMVSAWTAAVVVNTCLRDEKMSGVALDFFNQRENEVFANYQAHSAEWFRQAAGNFGRPFWTSRAGSIDETAVPSPAALQKALEGLRNKPALHLRLARGVRIEQRPGIEGDRVTLHDALVAAGDNAAHDYLDNVNLPRLAELAERHSQVPDIFEAYNRMHPPVALPNFLKALATLVATGILIDRAPPASRS